MPGDKLKSTNPNGIGRFTVPAMAVFGAAVLCVTLLIAASPAVADSEEVEVFGRRLVLAIPDGYCRLDERFELDRDYLAFERTRLTDGSQHVATYAPCGILSRERAADQWMMPIFFRYRAQPIENSAYPPEVRSREAFVEHWLREGENTVDEEAFTDARFEHNLIPPGYRSTVCTNSSHASGIGETALYYARILTFSAADAEHCSTKLEFFASTIVNEVLLKISWTYREIHPEDRPVHIADLWPEIDALIERTIDATGIDEP